ncbi:hypothetical protein [Caballeronia sp. GAWG2-1]|uniref:hypothetical protein n=1 Tax=Caballeronia sp. GAWG2-1 TaxID=2921744 RepID=UPI002029736A|nr:hypothetical protein [Caballeronia sp. GAWG2-1]
MENSRPPLTKTSNARPPCESATTVRLTETAAFESPKLRSTQPHAGAPVRHSKPLETVMRIVRLALKRPHTYIVLAVLLVILGSVAIVRTPTDIFPIVSIGWSDNGS